MTTTKLAGNRALVAVVGDASATADSVQWKAAFDVGKLLIDGGYRVLTGGLGGVMEAASRGARASTSWRSGDIVGVLPGSDRTAANPFVDVVLCAGLDHGRNVIVGQAQALIAIGGGAGTLTEIAFAWIYRRLVIGVRCGGWSERLADQRVDDRVRYPNIPDDCVYGARDSAEAVAILDSRLDAYIDTHGTIRRRP